MRAKIIACFALSAVLWGGALILVGGAVKDAIGLGSPAQVAMAATDVG